MTQPTAIEFAPAFLPLFEPYDYKVFHGGRGSGKSWQFAKAAILQSYGTKQRWLCTRQFQTSIKDSVHKLLVDEIWRLKLQDYFHVTDTEIQCTYSGSEFIFKGIQRSINEIKSTEGIDRCWVEEAQSVTADSWEILIPTIRKEDSEIWVSFNPDLEEDATFNTFVAHPQPNSLVRKVSWRDNPWFPKNLDKKRLHMRATDFETYRNVWEGECRKQVSNPLWTKQTIDGCRLPAWSTEDERQTLIATMQRIVVAVDPSGCSGKDDERSDEIGISVAGVGHDGIGRVLADLSGRYSPHGWAQVACTAYKDWKADRIVAEKNFGGAMVESTIRTANANVPVTMIDASRGKQARAEPVAALYEHGKVKHIGFFPDLERQMLQFSTSGYKGARSPDRADALAWSITSLMLEDSTTGLLDYYRELRNGQKRQHS